MEILQLKGFTNFGIALSVGRLVYAIMHNERCVLPLSFMLNGQYSIHDVALSLPCIITSEGIERVLEPPLDEDAQRGLENCANKLKSVIRKLEL